MIPASGMLALSVFCQDVEAAKPQGKDGHVEIYDVRDLALPARMRSLLPESEPESDRGRSVRDKALADLRDLGYVAGGDDGVRANSVAWNLLEALLQSLFSSEPAFSCQATSSGALVVRARAEVHERVARLLADLRAPDAALVTVELRGFELDAKQRRLLVDLEDPGAAGDEFAIARIQHVAQETIERLRVMTVVLPTVTAVQIEPFDVRIVNECSYVSKYDLVAIEGIGRIADPVVKTVAEGLTIQGRVVAAPGMDWKDTPFAIRLEIENAILKRPIQTVKTDLGEIQLPELKHATISTTVAGSVGRSFLVGGVPKATFDEKESDKRLYFLVTVGAPTQAAAAPSRSQDGR